MSMLWSILMPIRGTDSRTNDGQTKDVVPYFEKSNINILLLFLTQNVFKGLLTSIKLLEATLQKKSYRKGLKS